MSRGKLTKVQKEVISRLIDGEILCYDWIENKIWMQNRRSGEVTRKLKTNFDTTSIISVSREMDLIDKESTICRWEVSNYEHIEFAYKIYIRSGGKNHDSFKYALKTYENRRSKSFMLNKWTEENQSWSEDDSYNFMKNAEESVLIKRRLALLEEEKELLLYKIRVYQHQVSSKLIGLTDSEGLKIVDMIKCNDEKDYYDVICNKNGKEITFNEFTLKYIEKRWS